MVGAWFIFDKSNLQNSFKCMPCPKFFLKKATIQQILPFIWRLVTFNNFWIHILDTLKSIFLGLVNFKHS